MKTYTLHQISEENIVYGIVQPNAEEKVIPFIQTRDLSKAINFDQLDKTSEKIHSEYTRSQVKSGDIVIPLRGFIGEGQLLVNAPNKINISRGVAKLRVSKNHSNYYVEQLLNSDKVRREFTIRSQGSSLKEISIQELKKIQIPLPPLPTQRRIAAILQTWDRAIQLAEQQLEDLQTRKRGLMQLLLTGKKRLPEFEGQGEWEEVKLREVTSFLKSNSLSREKLSTDSDAIGPYVIHYGDLHELGSITRVHDLESAFTKAIVASDKHGSLLQTGDIVLSDASEDLKGIGMSIELGNFGKAEVVPGLHTIALRPNPEMIHYGFLGFLLSSEEIRNAMRRVSQGASVKGLSKSEVAKLEILLPTKAEQEQITTALDYTEDQITNTTKSIATHLLQKRGLMQRLLEGEVEVGEDIDEILGL